MNPKLPARLKKLLSRSQAEAVARNAQLHVKATLESERYNVMLSHFVNGVVYLEYSVT